MNIMVYTYPFDQSKRFLDILHIFFLFLEQETHPPTWVDPHRWMETSMTRAWSALEGAETVLTPGSGKPKRLRWWTVKGIVDGLFFKKNHKKIAKNE